VPVVPVVVDAVAVNGRNVEIPVPQLEDRNWPVPVVRRTAAIIAPMTAPLLRIAVHRHSNGH